MLKLNQYSLISAGCLMGVVVLLSACSGEDVSRAFGLKRSMPDEYTVTTRSPLSMPSSDNLMMPGKMTQRPQEQSIRQQTLEILSPDAALQGVQDVPSSGQSDLVQQASQSSKIERQHELAIDGSFVDQVMFWKSGNPDDLAVDGAAENKRLHNNLSLGLSPDQGATATTTEKQVD